MKNIKRFKKSRLFYFILFFLFLQFNAIAQIPTDGLVAWYPFIDGSMGDSSGNGNHGYDKDAIPAPDRFGNINNSFEFNGSTSYINCGNGTSLDINNAITLSAWIKSDFTFNGRILSKFSTPPGAGYELNLYNQIVGFTFNNTQYVQSDISARANQWIHIVGTYDGDTVKLFIDGSLQSTFSYVTTIVSTTSDLYLGVRSNLASLTYFKGSIDDVRIYNRALTNPEIEVLYRDGGWGEYPGEYKTDANTVLLMHMNETSGSILHDVSGYANDGNAINTGSVNGRFGPARSFTGTSSYVNLPISTSLQPLNRISLEAWIQLSNLSTSSIPLIMAGGLCYGLSIEQEKASFTLTAGGTNYSLISDKILQLAKWYHLAAIYDGSTMKLFINGVLDKQRTASGNIDYSTISNGITIAYYYGNSSYYRGTIDEVRISNKDRLSQEFNLQLRPKILGAAVDSSKITLTWQNGGGAVPLWFYRVYTGSDSTNLVFTDSSYTTFLKSPDLVPGIYYARVSAVDITGFEGAVSYAVGAEIPLPVPIQIYPPNGGIIVSNDSVKWTSVPNATSYHIQISTTPTFTGGFIVNDSLYADTIHWIGTTTPDEHLYWRVRAKNATVSSPFSSGRNFTIGLPPAVPMNLQAFAGDGVDTLKWNKNTEVDFLCYRIYYGTSSPASILIDSVMSIYDTVKVITGLVNGTTYYFRIKAMDNIRLESGFSNEVSSTPFSGGIDTPLAPSELYANISSPGIYIDWTDNSDNEDGFRIERKADIGDVYSEIATVATDENYYQDNSVSAGYTYYYRVRAYNGWGYSNFSNEANITTLSDLTSPEIYDNTGTLPEVTVYNGTASPSPVYISAWVADNESGVTSFDLQYLSNGDMQPTNVAFDPSYSSTQSREIPGYAFVSYNGRAKGVSYRLVAVNGAGLIEMTPWVSIVVKNGQSITSEDPQPAASNYSNKVQAYRIFSIPFELEDKRPWVIMNSSFGEHFKDGVAYANWRLQRYISSNIRQDYEEFKDDQLAFDFGKGFFLIVFEPDRRIILSPNSKAVKADYMNDVGISLYDGWNIVGTPLNTDIPFDSITFVNGNNVDRAYFDGNGPHGGWWKPGDFNPQQPCDVMKPWQGLAIRVNGIDVMQFRTLSPQLKVGTSAMSGKAPLTKQAIPSVETFHWFVPVDAYRSDINMYFNGDGFGMAQNAKEGHDEFDSYMPPFVGERNVAVYFNNPDGAMMHDIRPINDEGEIWDMHVLTGDASARVKLQFGDTRTLPNTLSECYLIDLDERMAYDLKEISALEINSGNGTRNFRIVVGNKLYMEQNNGGIALTPSEMRLYANYPNPFNPETVIRYTVPDASRLYTVILKIFNVLGQEIATLVNKQQKSGYYEVKWDARQQSSGIYFYQISITNGNQAFQDIKKMVLMK